MIKTTVYEPKKIFHSNDFKWLDELENGLVLKLVSSKISQDSRFCISSLELNPSKISMLFENIGLLKTHFIGD